MRRRLSPPASICISGTVQPAAQALTSWEGLAVKSGGRKQSGGGSPHLHCLGDGKRQTWSQSKMVYAWASVCSPPIGENYAGHDPYHHHVTRRGNGSKDHAFHPATGGFINGQGEGC